MNIGFVFGVIFTMVLIGFIIIFGYQQFLAMQKLQNEALIAQNLDRFKNSVDNVFSIGGDAAQEFEFTMPDTARKICFIPLFKIRQTVVNGRPVNVRDQYSKGFLSSDLRVIMDADPREREQLVSSLVATRIVEIGSKTTDRNYTVLLFRYGETVPQWYHIPYLAPSKKSSGGSFPQPLCIQGISKIWLERKYDDFGAWVDVSEN